MCETERKKERREDIYICGQISGKAAEKKRSWELLSAHACIAWQSTYSFFCTRRMMALVSITAVKVMVITPQKMDQPHLP